MLPFASGLAQPSRPDVFRPLAVDQRHGHRLTESVCDYIHYCIVKVYTKLDVPKTELYYR